MLKAIKTGSGNALDRSSFDLAIFTDQPHSRDNFVLAINQIAECIDYRKMIGLSNFLIFQMGNYYSLIGKGAH